MRRTYWKGAKETINMVRAHQQNELRKVTKKGSVMNTDRETSFETRGLQNGGNYPKWNKNKNFGGK